MTSITIAALAALQLTLAAGDGGEPDPRDKGADKIDVSGYPKEQQARYELFAQKCVRCHALARSINSKFTADEWKRYMKRMVRRTGAGVTDDQAQEIFEFLKFYSSKLGVK
jgi:hypothetical protein